MQELQVNIEQAKVEIVGQEVFEKGIADVVAKYQNYTVTAGTIKDDKKILAEPSKFQTNVSKSRMSYQNQRRILKNISRKQRNLLKTLSTKSQMM